METKKKENKTVLNFLEGSEKLNVHSKLALAKNHILNNRVIKMNGSVKNKSGTKLYDYYKLEDIVPPITETNAIFGLSYEMTKESENYVFNLINCHNLEDRITIKEDAVTAKIINANALQEIGGRRTFILRIILKEFYGITDSENDTDKHQEETKNEQEVYNNKLKNKSILDIYKEKDYEDISKDDKKQVFEELCEEHNVKGVLPKCDFSQADFDMFSLELRMKLDQLVPTKNEEEKF